MKNLALVTTLLIGCLAATAQATTTAATQKVVVRQEVVSFADLDVQSESGAKTLLTRIKFAARRVCGVNDAGLIAIEFRAERHRCAKDATARAVADVDARSIVVANVR
jgi:UrcA family protein